MTDEERRLITAFVERISGAAPIAQAKSAPQAMLSAAMGPSASATSALA